MLTKVTCVALATSALLLAGCERVDCNTTLYYPVSGSPADYTLQPGERDGYAVLAPVACGPGPGIFIKVRGLGTRHLGYWGMPRCAGADGGATDGGGRADAERTDGVGSRCYDAYVTDFTAELQAKLVAAQVWVTTKSDSTLCTDARTGRAGIDQDAGHVGINDWRKAEAVVGEVGAQIAAWNLADSFGVMVEGLPYPRPSACDDD